MIRKKTAERARERYLRQIRRLLPEKRGETCRLIGQLRLNLEGELPDADYAELCARFGQPEEIAASYVDGRTPQELLRVVQVRRNVMRIVIASLLIVLLAVGGFFLNLLRQLPVDRTDQFVVFEVVSKDELSDEELPELIHDSPQYAEAFGRNKPLARK